MKRGILVAVAGAAIVISGLFIGAERWRENSTTAATLAPGSTVAATGKVKIDGVEEDVHGSCFARTDGHSVNISLSGATTKANVALDDAQPPNVSSVVLSNASGAMLYEAGKEGSAQATKDGNTYHITGSVLFRGFVGKPFEITATCA